MMIPIDVTVKFWMESLVIDFPDDNIPLLEDEKDWKDVGSFLVQENSFAIQGAPSPASYEKASDWMLEVYKCMNNF